MKIVLLFLFILIPLTGVAQHRKLVADKNDFIYYEVFDSTTTNPNRYTEDNIIFTPGKVFEYDYFMQKKDKKYKYLFDRALPAEHKNIPIDLLERYPNAIRKLTIEVKSGLDTDLVSFSPDWAQTTIVISYLMSDNRKSNFDTETTGVIENEKNIWIHPPRTASFKALQMIPFPQIVFPIEKGFKHSRNRKCFDPFEYKPYKCIETYEVVEEVVLNTSFGELGCVVILQTNVSELGTGSLKHYFNEEYGFVRMEYENLLKEQLILELTTVKYLK